MYNSLGYTVYRRVLGTFYKEVNWLRYLIICLNVGYYSGEEDAFDMRKVRWYFLHISLVCLSFKCFQSGADSRQAQRVGCTFAPSSETWRFGMVTVNERIPLQNSWEISNKKSIEIIGKPTP